VVGVIKLLFKPLSSSLNHRKSGFIWFVICEITFGGEAHGSPTESCQGRRKICLKQSDTTELVCWDCRRATLSRQFARRTISPFPCCIPFFVLLGVICMVVLGFHFGRKGLYIFYERHRNKETQPRKNLATTWMVSTVYRFIAQIVRRELANIAILSRNKHYRALETGAAVFKTRRGEF